jgi:hypothetical protein
MMDGVSDFEFIADEDGCHSREEHEAKDPRAEPRSQPPELPMLPDDWLPADDGMPDFRRLPGGAVVNSRNGRSVAPKLLPVEGGCEVAMAYFCYDGNPADPVVKPGTDVYRSVNRGAVVEPEDALAWLLGKWPSSLEFIEGLSERLNG